MMFIGFVLNIAGRSEIENFIIFNPENYLNISIMVYNRFMQFSLVFR